MTKLPSDITLNIASLAGALDDVTSSYKFLWILGILDMLEQKEKEKNTDTDNGIIQTKDIVEKMLTAADAPLNRYRLFFGAGDKMKEYIEKWQNAQKEDSKEPQKTSGKSNAEKELTDIRRRLTRYVPALFMTPFFEGKGDLPGNSDERVKKICKMAAVDWLSSTATPPLYRIELKWRPTYIEIHPKWRKYLFRHREIIRGWVHFKWIGYLQARNPLTPSIINKIAYPDKRENVGHEREWWGKIIKKCGGVKCIYSDTKILPGDKFQLDHYIPWSYVAHNKLWNLIPVMGCANASKSDHLPKEKEYFSKFVKIQHDALKVSEKVGSGYKDITSAYADDLKIKIQSEPPLGIRKLSTAYSIVLPPLIELARTQGFSYWNGKIKSHVNSRKINL